MTDKQKITLCNINLKVADYVSYSRYAHSVAVCRAANKICMVLNLTDEDLLYKISIAAICHDIAKDIPRDEQISMLSHYEDLSVDQLNNMYAKDKKPIHGILGAYLAQDIFGTEVIDDDIFYAIKWHTYGSPEMNDFAKIIYLADTICDGREEDYYKQLKDEIFRIFSDDSIVVMTDKSTILDMAMINALDLEIRLAIVKSDEISIALIMTRNSLVNNLYNITPADKEVK